MGVLNYFSWITDPGRRFMGVLDYSVTPITLWKEIYGCPGLLRPELLMFYWIPGQDRDDEWSGGGMTAGMK